MPSFVKYTTVAAAVLAALSAGRVLADPYVATAGGPLRSAYGDYWQSAAANAQPQPEPQLAEPNAVPQELAKKPVKYSAEVLFAFDDDVLTSDARKQLDEIAQKLLAMELESAVAVGHADAVGTPQYNRRLSARRAKAVGDYLAGKGVPMERLQLVAMGQEGPQPERRVDIELVGLELIGPEKPR